MYHDVGVKVLLEAPTMMGIRMAKNAGDMSDYHVINYETLPPMDTPFQLNYHKGTLLDVLKSGVLPKVHIFYADYCGSPLKTSGPIKKDPPLEAKYIESTLHPRGIAIFTFCRRGCKNPEKVASKLLEGLFKTAYVHKYGSMMVYICVKGSSSDKVVSDVRYKFLATLGRYYSRSTDLISPEEKALVMVHKNKKMKMEEVSIPEECEVCLNWFNQHNFFIDGTATNHKTSDVCICQDCWQDIVPSDSYDIVSNAVVWHTAEKSPVIEPKNSPVIEFSPTSPSTPGHDYKHMLRRYQKLSDRYKKLCSATKRISDKYASMVEENEDLVSLLKTQEKLSLKMANRSRQRRDAIIQNRRFKVMDTDN